MIKLKRAYDEPSEQDGLRVRVDRIWPRGLSNKTAAIDVWMWNIAPCTELRKWFGHDPGKWEQFCVRYANELDAKADKVALLKAHDKTRTVTLLYGAKDVARNNAVALKQYLERSGPAATFSLSEFDLAQGRHPACAVKGQCR